MKKPAKQWARLLHEVTKGKSGEALQEAVASFVAYLDFRNERSRWREVVRAFDDVWRKEHGAGTVELAGAEAPSEKWRAHIEAVFPGAEVRLTARPELLGGVLLQIDDKQMDQTLRAKLHALKMRLTSNV